MQSDIERMQADPNFSLDSSDGVYIVFLCIGIIGYFTIPTVAGWIIQAGGMDGCRMRNGFHFEYKGLHMTYHKTLPYSTIVETGDDGITYDILYDILIKQNGEIHSDWTGVKLDVEKYRHVTYEPYDLRVLDGTIDF